MSVPGTPSPYFQTADLRGKILGLLKEKGTYVPAWELPERLLRRYGSPVEEAMCSRALQALIAARQVQQSPDQESMVKVPEGPLSKIDVEDLASGEINIMPILKAYLHGDFRTVIEGGAKFGYSVIDTSRRGPSRGTWRRPDFTVINVIDLDLIGRRQVDVHSFELKTEKGCSVPAVYEALSQARETHYGYLVWDLPKHSPREADLAEVEDACQLHGIGLILLRCSTGRLAVRPRRQPTTDIVVQTFLFDRLEQEDRTWLIGKISEGR